MIRRAFVRLAVAAALSLPLAACGGDGGTGLDTELSGTYTLRTVNGQALPYVVESSGPNDRFELLGDEFTFSSRTFTETTDFRVTERGVVTTDSFEDSGRYTLDGNALTVTFDSDGSSATGAVDGNTFTLAGEGFVFLYRKR